LKSYDKSMINNVIWSS